MRHRLVQRGLTLLELIVAVAICLILASAAVVGFIEAMRARDLAQARLEGVANARHAIETMAIEIKRARLLPASAGGFTTSSLYFVPFTLATADLFRGDGKDNDRDGVVDEEPGPDSRDNDNDWVSAQHDTHVRIPYADASGGVYERVAAGGRADLGDFRVDEDCKFTQAELAFETFPLPGDAPRRAVKFYVGNDGEGGNTTLFREVRTFDPGSGTETTSVGPIARNVVSFAALAYDPQGVPGNIPWQTGWSASARFVNRATFPEVPVSMYLRVEVYTGTPRSVTEIANGQRMDTQVLSTVIDVESVLADPRYTALRPVQTTVGP